MSEGSVLLIEPPDPKSGLRIAAEAERRKIELWEQKQIKAIRNETIRLQREVAQAEASLTQSAGVRAGRPKKRGPVGRRRRKTTAVGQKQREGILGLLRGENRDMAMSEVRKALNIPDSSARNAMLHLVEAGMVRQIGSGSKTRYRAASAKESRSKRGLGTLQGRILEAIAERERASLEELSAIVGAPVEEVQRNCGALIRDEEIHMDRIDGLPVYVVAESANG
jgi:predicted transcriptional regulator